MTGKVRQKLTLDQPASYQIKVPGYLGQRWAEWAGGMEVAIENDRVDLPITTLTGTLDQAALHGLLRRLYSLGLPLISVTCLEAK